MMEIFLGTQTPLDRVVHEILSRLRSRPAFNVVVACTAAWVFIRLMNKSRTRVRTPKLRGPSSSSFMYGVGRQIMESQDPALIYESWAVEYGAAFEIPTTFGERKIVLYDPKAIAHFNAKQSYTYVRTPMVKKSFEHGIGRGLLWAEGDSHKRQRKSLTPAFSIAAIRKLIPIFYDSAHKAKGAWNGLIESSGGDGAIIDVQSWMNYISLDTIGLACFSHDFGALDGNHASVTEVFDTFTSSSPPSAFSIGLDLLAQTFPFLVRVPTLRTRLLRKLNVAMEEISNVLLARTKQELDLGAVDGKEEKSIIGLLIKGESAGSEFHLSKEEVLSQMKVMIIAGYETTSVSLTWALIELSRNPDIQTSLRNELLEHGSDPTYDGLSNGLPYLDAVVHEVLRLHAPVREMSRVATEDDIVPLSEPVRTNSGQLVDNLSIAKGTMVLLPMASVNRSVEIWGEDAKVFKPSRWLVGEYGRDGIPAKAKEVQGHRHLLTFSDGPRVCLGKNFAVLEFKAVLSVLVKNFVFELCDGPETKIEMGRGLLPRPRVAGEAGCKVPLLVKPYVG